LFCLDEVDETSAESVCIQKLGVFKRRLAGIEIDVSGATLS
jgi:hypothetical protein